MINVFLRRTFGAFLPVIISIFFINTISAQVPCGTISYLDEDATLIDDCSDPFKRTLGASPVVVTIGGSVVNEGMIVEIEGESTDTFTFDFDIGFGYTPALFKHVVDAYVEQPFEAVYPEGDPTEAEYRTAMIAYFPEGTSIDTFAEAAMLDSTDTLTEAEEDMYYGFMNYYYPIFHAPQWPAISLGTFTAVFTEKIICVSSIDRSWVDRIYSWIIPTAHAQYCSGTPRIYTLTFEIAEKSIVLPVDPLILQYAPILYFHPSEDYFPMDVESFMEASALWETGSDTQLKTAGELTFEEFESVVESGIDTSDMYLAFSDPDTPGSIDLQRAKSTYVALKQDDPTVYYHKMTDTTDYGKTFTVLQYWYFYAMNNWGEKDGYNDHEGDWESTFVFLNDDEEPEYVAYSSHLNDQYAFNNIKQYSSVRREWNSEYIGKDGDRVKDYVALGSHANYFDSDTLNNTVPTLRGFKFDKISSSGGVVYSHLSSLTKISTESWTEYEGLWGTYTDTLGGNGPQGPTHINITGQTRFSEPVEWSGLNNFFKLAVNTATDTVEDTKQGIKMVFDVLLDIGTKIVIERYDEYIAFGTNVAQFRPLPFFFDVTSDTDTSGVTMTLSYDPEYLGSIGELAADLVILYYNPATDLVEVLDSVVDTEDHTVTAYTPHLSRYLLGFEEKEVVVESEIAVTTVQTTRSYGTRVQRPEAKVLGVSATVRQGQVEQIEVLAEEIMLLLSRQEDLTETQRKVLSKVLMKALNLLEGI
jgi:hypothetical protein